MGLINQFFENRKFNYELVRDVNGKYQIGGIVPEEFKIPSNQFPAGFQYLGFIDNSDPLFNWLPFKTHLIHPIYTNEYFVYPDYSNPNIPTIIEQQNTEASTTAFDEIDKNSKIIFEGIRVSAEKKNKIDEFDSIAICGTTKWLQESETPIYPKSGKPMKFLCQLGSFSGIKSTYTNIAPIKGMEEYFENLNFWCDGNLYIFFEPETKTMCYSMQNT